MLLRFRRVDYVPETVPGNKRNLASAHRRH